MSEAIWRRVHRSAEELTRQGITPFTRGDLVRCVQQGDPDCSPDSINPIIQGLTDNLRGGAPGAIGKNLLHSVGRGHFVLNDVVRPSSSVDLLVEAQHRARPTMTAKNEVGKSPIVSTRNHCRNLDIGGYTFAYICAIQPERAPSGIVQRFSPQIRYNNFGQVPLNKYGSGPFCKFKIPRDVTRCGVYAIVGNQDVLYVGETASLSARFNIGHGHISPRNCFVEGPETNCRINNLVLECTDAGVDLCLWFCETDDYKHVESELRQQGAFAWNRT